MFANLGDLLESIAKIAAVSVGVGYIMLALILVPCPLNYFAAPLPAYIAFIYAYKDDLRFIRLGFAHDRVREVSEERMRKALDEYEREYRKTKHL